MEDLNGKLIYVHRDKLYYFEEGGPSRCAGDIYDLSTYCSLYSCANEGDHPLLSEVCPMLADNFTVTGRWREL